MKSLSNTFRQIALVIMLLIWVVILATCQGSVKGTDKDAATRSSNPAGSNVDINLTANTTWGAENFMANCVGCHSGKSVGGNQSIGSMDITGPALATVDSMKVNLFAPPTELSWQILK
jgi:cytochrome c peroxidase